MQSNFEKSTDSSLAHAERVVANQRKLSSEGSKAVFFWKSDSRLDTPDIQTCQAELPACVELFRAIGNSAPLPSYVKREVLPGNLKEKSWKTSSAKAFLVISAKPVPEKWDAIRCQWWTDI
jgi:hypothetical protein